MYNQELNGTIEANESIDIWGFGVTMYYFFTNKKPLFRCEQSDDTLYGEVEKSRLVNWDWLSSEELDKILPGCTNRTLREKAQNFFKKCLHGDIEQRHKNTEAILDDPLFSRANKEVNQEVMIKEIRKVVEKDGKETRENIKVVSSKLDDLNTQLDMFKKATISMMRALVSGSEFAPAMMLFVPQKKGIKPSNWLNKEVKVMFICPVTMRVPNDSNDDPLHYIIKLPKDWVKKFGPTILMSLNVLKIACGIGSIVGFAPLKIADKTRKLITDNSSTLTSMYDELKKLPELESTHMFIEKMYKDPHELKRTKPIEGTHGAIAVSKLFKPLDNTFKHSGLVLATDMHGVSEYIHKDIKLVFEKHGFKECLQMKTEDLHEKNRELLIEAKKEEDEYERLFSKIKENNEVVDNSDILAKGYMQNKAIKEKKIKNVFSRFNERYFILKRDGILLYYTSKNDAEIGTSAFYGHKLLKKVERVYGTNEMKFEFANSNDELPIIQRFRILPIRDDDCDKWVEAAKQITYAKTKKN